jgi:hypothetical protein
MTNCSSVRYLSDCCKCNSFLLLLFAEEIWRIRQIGQFPLDIYVLHRVPAALVGTAGGGGGGGGVGAFARNPPPPKRGTSVCSSKRFRNCVPLECALTWTEQCCCLGRHYWKHKTHPVFNYNFFDILNVSSFLLTMILFINHPALPYSLPASLHTQSEFPYIF